MKGYDEGVQDSPRSPGLRAGLFVLRDYSSEVMRFAGGVSKKQQVHSPMWNPISETASKFVTRFAPSGASLTS